MKKSRDWTQYPKNINRELNGTSGLAAVGLGIASVVGLASSAFAASGLGIAITGSGVLLTACAIGKSLWNAVPEQFCNPSDLVGQQFALAELPNIRGNVKKLCVVGPTKAGKSTLVKVLLSQDFPNQRTSEIYASIAVLPSAPLKYLILLDGSGGQFGDQFEIARYADVILVVFDHEESDDVEQLDKARLDKSKEFSDQLIGFLSKHKNTTTELVHILLNKRDLWERLSIADQNYITRFLNEEQEKWTRANVASNVSSEAHSNFETEDIGILVRKLATFF